jgi:hypothetical protein
VNRHRDHDEIEALLALEALGGASEGDRQRLRGAMAGHGPECRDCRTLRGRAQEVAGLLALTEPPRRLPDGFEDRLVAAARAGRAPTAVQRRSRLATLLAAAAALVLAFATGWLARPSPSTPLASLSDARVVRMEGSAGTMALAYRPGVAGAILFATDVAPPPSDRVYELWLIRDGTPVRQGCFAPSRDGGPVLVVSQEIARPSDTAAVTIEAASCPSAPTTKPIMSATLE